MQIILVMLPQNILDQFARIPLDTTIENKYYGVYNKILDRTFNASGDTFTVQPQYALPQAQTHGVTSVPRPGSPFLEATILLEHGTDTFSPFSQRGMSPVTGVIQTSSIIQGLSRRAFY